MKTVQFDLQCDSTGNPVVHLQLHLVCGIRIITNPKMKMLGFYRYKMLVFRFIKYIFLLSFYHPFKTVFFFFSFKGLYDIRFADEEWKYLKDEHAIKSI